MTETAVAITSVISFHVSGEDGVLTLACEDGQRLRLRIPEGTDREIVHLMADGLRARSRKGFDRGAGHLLLEGQLKPARIEKSLSALELRERFVLHAQTEGSTAITMRLTPESVRRWIDDMERMLAARRPRGELS